MTGSPPVPSALDTLMQDMLMKRRLMIDGDGMGDERKIMNLTRLFLTFCSETNPEELVSMEKKILNQISQVEQMLKKSLHLTQVHQEGIKSYEYLDEKVKSEISKTKEEISTSKTLLEEARQHRKQMTEYSALAQVIRDQADRKETEKKKAILDGNLDKLKKQHDQLDSRISERKATMSILADAIKSIDDLVYGEERKIKEREEAKAKAAALAAAEAAKKPAEVRMDIDEAGPSPKTSKPPRRESTSVSVVKPEVPPVEAAGSKERSTRGSKSRHSPEKMDIDKTENYDDVSD